MGNYLGFGIHFARPPGWRRLRRPEGRGGGGARGEGGVCGWHGGRAGVRNYIGFAIHFAKPPGWRRLRRGDGGARGVGRPPEVRAAARNFGRPPDALGIPP